ncbi:shikimate dehydrogenase [Thermoanaerobacterium sp. RBIITD]|uniref:shikimate dehydrogenase n=1 Tax=Thermoanaerobacterium sp. RBIITD TaxID=1550240 RepID=UPI000BB72EEA|nr:shikimate dehydrogenase [Thermoanaerobacterium sp. RBIITD]SNX55337.1 shikimate dehydrogenase [Thermoanaerobacterium sp. RBIITD]
MNIDSKTKIYGLIGHPVGHSLSPLIHNTAFLDQKLNCIYDCFDVLPENIKDAVFGIKALGIMGVNVTVPYKEMVIPYLDFISDEAKLIGAVNTIKNNDGRLEGYNTDASGFIESLLEQGVEIRGKNVVILGAGGAARAIAVAFSLNDVNSITIANRTEGKAYNLYKYIKEKFRTECKYTSLDELIDFDNIDILINATSVGMFPNVNATPVDEKIIRKAKFIYDLIYNPKETLFLRYAKKYGIKNSNGLNMLINQANNSFKIWFGKNFNKNLIVNVLRKKEFIK